jgi:hypothetical protein
MMGVQRVISPMLHYLLGLFRLSSDPRDMAAWTRKVERIVRDPPGSDEGFSPESIAWWSASQFSNMSNWAIICEEVLDTQFPRIYHQRAWEELRRRRVSDAEIQEMRRFAWLTAGWLNFEKMLWDWRSLDEKDILTAIEWQYSSGLISSEERDRQVSFAERYI